MLNHGGLSGDIIFVREGTTNGDFFMRTHSGLLHSDYYCVFVNVFMRGILKIWEIINIINEFSTFSTLSVDQQKCTHNILDGWTLLLPAKHE